MFQIHYCQVAAVPQTGLGHGEEGGEVLQAGRDETVGTVEGPAVTSAGAGTGHDEEGGQVPQAGEDEAAGGGGKSLVLGTGSSKQSL